MELKWEEPPAEAFITQSSGFYAKVAAALRSRPHEWAILPREYASAESAQQAARNLVSGKIKAMPKGMFEARSAEKKIWIRFHPENDNTMPPEPDASSNVRPLNPENAKIREWAKGLGVEISDRGRLPKELIERYRAAMVAEDGAE